MLENILGMPPPEPPKNVPALTPDTPGRRPSRSTIQAHLGQSYYACHQNTTQSVSYSRILTLWVKRGWPKIDTRIDPRHFPDGTPIKGITDFKAWLVDNIDPFRTLVRETDDLRDRTRAELF